MVDFALSDEQEAIRKLAHDFAVKEMRPVAAYYDEREEMPFPVMHKAVRLGLTGWGRNAVNLGDGISHFMIAEEFNWGCAGIANAIFGSGLAAAAILVMGTTEQKQHFVPLCVSDDDEIRLGAMAITEPGAGSDVSGIETTATRDGDDYVLNGRKCFITNGGIADVHVIIATEDKHKGWAGIGAYVVTKDTPGLSMGRKDKKMGIRASHTAEVILEDCRIPVEHKLGWGAEAEGTQSKRMPAGPFGALTTLERTRPAVAAGAVGVARAAFEFARDYAKNRVQFGRPIADNQAIAFMLADMAVDIDAARLLAWRAGWMASHAVPMHRGEGSMSKVYAGDVAMRVTTNAVQIAGGYGYTRDFPLEKWMRDAKIYQIFEGTAEVQRVVISRAILNYP